jgi:galactokinase/mevalonate kinase-like predicted kinase
MAREFGRLEGRSGEGWFGASDPGGVKLGSGGGLVALMDAARRQGGEGLSWDDWLGRSRKMAVLGGGQSRRLPAYAAVGKLFMPIPVFRWSVGQHLGQSLLDLQQQEFGKLLEAAPAGTELMVASGDVLLRMEGNLPHLPAADVVCLGIGLKPEKACNFGVFFCRRDGSSGLEFFLQKPSAEKIRELCLEHTAYADTGVWLFSRRALRMLLARCGWDEETRRFPGGWPAAYELYARFGPCLGARPVETDPEIAQLSCAVVPLPAAEFYHFGTSRQMIESMAAIQNLQFDRLLSGTSMGKPHPEQFVQNAKMEFPLGRDSNHTLWVENAHVPASWSLTHSHVLTGLPANDWNLRLPPGTCLDWVPVSGGRSVVRVYGIDDPFQGPLNHPATLWMGRPVLSWFEERGLDPAAAGLVLDGDIQQAPLFPVVGEDDGEFIQWLIEPSDRADFSKKWLESERLSASEIPVQVDLDRLYARRAERCAEALPVLVRNHRSNILYRLDLQRVARLLAPLEQPDVLDGLDPLPEEVDAMVRVHQKMLRSEIFRLRANPAWKHEEASAFSTLREAVLSRAAQVKVRPRLAVLEDQIVWGRSPARLDLAGGWSDTPPYCLEHGGAVVNVAVNLNGQPPVQVFAKLTREPHLVIRSIDLGIEERITTYDDLRHHAHGESAFPLARAALALAGFLPEFHADGGAPTLRQQLEQMGGGLEITLVAAIPKGSGLGTSSILSSTLLGTLGELLDLSWDRTALFERTLMLEQILTTGGGWQDQAGGLHRGVKLVETAPGLVQQPVLRFLPEDLFGPAHANRTLLLYYTGLTRLAKNILQEIVRGMMLNSGERLAILHEIRAHAVAAAAAIQTDDRAGLARAIARSWDLNCRLDPGTQTSEVEAILGVAARHCTAWKLLGAGGGGYALFVARDEEAGKALRRDLEEHRPNDKARFVDFEVSRTGLQITRS